MALEDRGLALTAEWAPREWNAEADALTNSRFEGFSPELRVPFDMRSYPWRVLSGLLEDGRAFYREAQAARSAAKLRAVARPKQGRRKRVSLKESVP